MQKIIVLTGMILFFGLTPCFAQEQLTITTYYPSPYGVYRILRLFPGSRPVTCEEGDLYYDDGAGSYSEGLYYCQEGTWRIVGACSDVPGAVDCWRDVDGDGHAPRTGDCDETCATCFVGSTATTVFPDGRDQDCDGIIDESVSYRVYEIVKYYRFSGFSCSWKCTNDGYDGCESVGINEDATNGTVYLAVGDPSICGQSSPHTCATSFFGVELYCAGQTTPWTNCRCYDAISGYQ